LTPITPAAVVNGPGVCFPARRICFWQLKWSRMSWFTRDKRKKLPATEIAANLFQAFVVDDAVVPEMYETPPDFAAKFIEQHRLYREAAVTFVLGNQASKEEPYRQVLDAFDLFIFPHDPIASGSQKLDDLRTAVDGLDQLVRANENGASIAWASDWFKRIGVEQCNPLVLFQFSYWWKINYITISKVVNEIFRPK